MKINSGLPRSLSHADLLAIRPGARVARLAPSQLQRAGSCGNLQEALLSSSGSGASNSSAGSASSLVLLPPRRRGREIVRAGLAGPSAGEVQFPAYDDINKRMSDTALWPPRVDGKMVAVVYRYCARPILDRAGKTYDVNEAAAQIVEVVQTMRQMMNAEQLRTLYVYMANVYVRNASLCDAVKARLRACWDPAR